MEDAYAPVVWRLPDDFDSYEAFLRALRRVNLASSPGIPYCTNATTNAEWLGWNGVCFDPARIAELWYYTSQYLGSPNEVMLRTFVKREPHTAVKVSEGRWRLILASPLHVQIVWHMFFDELNDLEIAKAYEIPSQQGLILPNGGWKMFLRQWQTKGYDTGLDKSAWDWNCPYWLLMLDLEFRKRMGRGARIEEWALRSKALYERMFADPCVVLSNGMVYKQTVPGVMKSGCVNTISTNSHMQVIVHVLACEDQGISPFPLPVAVGDDTLQRRSQATDISCYARYGAIIKSASDGLEFVGHEFGAAGPMPIYTQKHMTKIAYQKDEHVGETIEAMCRMYCKNSVMFAYWVELALELGCHHMLRSRDYYCYWYDYDY